MSTVRHHEFRSSNIKSIEHETDSGWLLVTFGNGSSYYYPKVSTESVDEWIAAPSAGKWFAQNLKSDRVSAPVKEQHLVDREIEVLLKLARAREDRQRLEAMRTAASSFTTMTKDMLDHAGALIDSKATEKTGRVSVRFKWPNEWSISVDGTPLDVKSIRMVAMEADANQMVPKLVLELYPDEIKIDAPAEIVEPGEAALIADHEAQTAGDARCELGIHLVSADSDSDTCVRCGAEGLEPV